MENGPFSKREVLFPRTNLVASRDKILMVFAVYDLHPLDDILTHPFDNHLLIKYKVLSYHGWNSGDSSTETDFLRNKNTYIFVSCAGFPNVANSAHL